MFFFKKPKSSFIVVSTIDSWALKALVYELSGNVVPSVVKKFSVRIPSGVTLHRHITKLREFLFSAVRQYGRLPRKVVIGIDSDIGDGSVVMWNAKLPPETRTVTVGARQTYFANLFEAHRDPRRGMIAYPAGFFVNGYPWQQVVRKGVVSGMAPIELQFSTFLIHFPYEVGVRLAEIKRSFGGMSIEFVPIIPIIVQAVGAVRGIQDAIFINVSGNGTSVTLVKEGIAAHTATFPKGVTYFLNRARGRLNMSLREAESYLSQFRDPALQHNWKQSHMALSREMSEWTDEFQKTIDSFFPRGPVPPMVFLFGNGAAIPGMALFLRSPHWMNSISYAARPDLQVLDASSVFGGSTLDGAVHGPEDVAMASLVYYSLNHDAFV